MKLNRQNPTTLVTVLAQDPSVLDTDDMPIFTSVEIPNERLSDGPKGTRIHVVDYDTSMDRYLEPWSSVEPIHFFKRAQAKNKRKAKTFTKDSSKARPLTRKALIKSVLDDPHFHAVNCYAIVASTLFEFEKALGRSVNWGFDYGSHQIKISPHAFCDMNAFYSRRDEALAFGYFPIKGPGKKFGFSCLSFDVIVHEATHAILDGLRTEYMRPSSIDQAAFHEAFADIVALLSAFKSKELITIALKSKSSDSTVDKKQLNPDNLRKSVLIGLAEQLGQSIYGGSLGRVRGDALRRSAHMPPKKIYKKQRSGNPEVHSFGEVLVAPIMNTFLEIWHKRVQPLDPENTGRVSLDRAIEEGAKAAEHLLRMCIRALDYLPPLNLVYEDYLFAILTADYETAIDDGKYGYRRALWKSFKAYGITDKTFEQCRWGQSEGGGYTPTRHDEICYGFSGHSEMQWDRESVYRFIWENNDALGLMETAFTKVVSVRPVHRRSPGGTIISETIVEYIQLLDATPNEIKEAIKKQVPCELRDEEMIRLKGGGTLIFSDYGNLKYHISSGVLSKRRTFDRLESMVKLGFYDKKPQGERRFFKLHRERAMGYGPERSEETW